MTDEHRTGVVRDMVRCVMRTSSGVYPGLVKHARKVTGTCLPGKNAEYT
jgi:hypothetical protein